MNRFPGLPVLLSVLLCGGCLRDGKPATSPPHVETAATIVARIRPPTFPMREFPITRYGAVAGRDCSIAIQTAVQACHDAGGGHVVIPPGTFLTGPVGLLSNVDLHLADSATLKFDPTPAKYLPLVLTRWEGTECMNYSPLIYADGQDNIAISGGGTLDGSAAADTWLGWNLKRPLPSLQGTARSRLMKMGEENVPVQQRVFGEGSFLRPNFIEFQRANAVLIEGVTILNSPMWVVHPVLSRNVTVRNIHVRSLGSNNDGCDPECCRDVLIEGCTFETGDDCIAIKSGRNNDGRRVGVPSENIVIRGCTMRDGHGGVTVGSEISGGCRNVFVEDCTMDSPHLNSAFRFKSNAQRGGTIENVSFRHIAIRQVAGAVLSIELNYEEGSNGGWPPTVRDISLVDVTAETCGQVLNVDSFEAATVAEISLSRCTFRGIRRPDTIRNAAEPIEGHVNRLP